MRPHLKMCGTSYRLDETYVKVGTEWKYLYRAIDSTGRTIEFMLSAKRDVSAAKRFFKKMMRAESSAAAVYHRHGQARLLP
jgi:transposase-like protein